MHTDYDMYQKIKTSNILSSVNAICTQFYQIKEKAVFLLPYKVVIIAG